LYLFNQIKLENFRNFDSFTINLSNVCNIIHGLNGSGKTNLLESISLFERGRGFRKDNLSNMINNNNNVMFKIKAKFINGKNDLDLLLSSKLHVNKLKKELLVNGSNSVESIKYFENLYSIIWFLPEMERIFLERPSLRRNFLDRLIYGVDKIYLKIVNNFKKKIIERSQILKKNSYDEDWINQVEREIVDYSIIIYRKRIEHIKILNSILFSLKILKKSFFQFELKMNDDLFKNYSIFDEELKSFFLLELKNARKFDSIIGGCKVGPHKTDIYGEQIEKNFNLAQCSTGQQKAIIILIIIAQCKYLTDSLNRRPIILFDEVCSHLDENNRKLLLELINSLDVQTFMTGTEKNFFSFLSTKANYYNIS